MPLAKLKPPALRPGDGVGIVAPASPIDAERLAAGVAGLEKLGYRAVYQPSILERDLYFAGSAKRRARELAEMFRRDDVHAILCARGGYGSNYLLPEFDATVARQHPKIFMGYSDATSLLTWLCDSAGIVTFHGPMLTKDFVHPDGVDAVSFSSALSGVLPKLPPDSGAAPLLRGEAEGILYGGCLSMLAAALGTPYEASTDGTLLFLEDIAAKPYQIDRMLMQLKLAGKFNGVRGVIFGEMLDCIQPGGQDYTLQEVVALVLGDLDIPVAYGLRSGHVSRSNITLPFGVRAALSVGDQVRLEFLEPATLSRTAADSAGGAP